MSSARETVLIAQDLFERLGPGGIELADTRSATLREQGDAAGAQFWRDVSHAMILMTTRPNSVLKLSTGSLRPENPLWALMQRIEGYRHLASEAEDVTRAVASSAGEMGRIAAGWRELAATLELLAGQLPEVMTPQPFSGSIYELN